MASIGQKNRHPCAAICEPSSTQKTSITCRPDGASSLQSIFLRQDQSVSIATGCFIGSFWSENNFTAHVIASDSRESRPLQSFASPGLNSKTSPAVKSTTMQASTKSATGNEFTNFPSFDRQPARTVVIVLIEQHVICDHTSTCSNQLLLA
jgi:hypothetical protein